MQLQCVVLTCKRAYYIIIFFLCRFDAVAGLISYPEKPQCEIWPSYLNSYVTYDHEISNFTSV